MAILSTQVDRDRNVGLIDTWVGARAVAGGRTIEWGGDGVLTALGISPEVENKQHERQTLRCSPATDPCHFLVFKPLCNPLPLYVGRFSGLLLPVE